MKVFQIVACVFTIVSVFMTILAAVFATFWSVSNISYFGIAGEYATFGLLAAVAAMATGLVATILIGVALLRKSSSKALPTVALIFVISTIVIAITVMVLSPVWVMNDILKYTIVSTMPSAGAILGGSVAVICVMALIMLILDRVVKLGGESA